jgi:hypothetical protein
VNRVKKGKVINVTSDFEGLDVKKPTTFGVGRGKRELGTVGSMKDHASDFPLH